MIGTLSPEDIERLVSNQYIGRIGCHAAGLTYIVPISYTYHDNQIYAHTSDGLKMELMRKNPSVCFQVDNTRNLANWERVICWGEFEELIDENERKIALELLNNRHLKSPGSETMHINPEWPFVPSQDEKLDGIFFRIRITEKTGRFEKAEATSLYTN